MLMNITRDMRCIPDERFDVAFDFPGGSGGGDVDHRSAPETEQVEEGEKRWINTGDRLGIT